jgi:hypothetical protein
MRFINPFSSTGEWEHIVKQFPESHLFHGAGWARVLESTYGHKPFYLAVFDNRGPITAIPVMEVASAITSRRGVSVPFSDFCRPLHLGTSHDEAAIETLIGVGFDRGWKSLRLGGPSAGSISQPDLFSYYSHEIDLQGTEEELFENCASSVRRAIRKAKDEGITVERTRSRQSLAEFYGLHCRTRRRHGLPPQPWKFFESIHREIVAPGNGLLFAAKKEGQTIAATLFLSWQDKVLYKFAASDLASQSLRPNNLIVWEAIRFFASAGFQTFHFGRTDLTAHGLRRFKLGWGSKEQPMRYCSYDFSCRRWSIVTPGQAGIHRRIFGRMPLFVNKIAGAAIYPHLD